MDFDTLMELAKKNCAISKPAKQSKYYNSNLAPPKKESRKKELSENVKKFLAQKEQEERSNRSVLGEAFAPPPGRDHFDVEGCDNISKETKAFFQKYIENLNVVKEVKGVQEIKDVKEKKRYPLGYKPTRSELNIIRDRVLKRIPVISQKPCNPRKTIAPKAEAASASSSTTSRPVQKKNHYEPKITKAQQSRTQNISVPRLVQDFEAFIQQTEMNNHEPAENEDSETYRTQKQKFRLEQRQEEFERRKMAMERSRLAIAQGKENRPMNPNGQLPTLNQTAPLEAPVSLTTSHPRSSKASSICGSSKSSSNGARPAFNGTTSSLRAKRFAAPGKLPPSSLKPATSGTRNGSKNTTNGTTRQVPPTDTKPNPRSAGIQSTADVRRPNKRRFSDTDDEEEHDSDLDDFIDDGSDAEDYSKHIKAIFGYDKSKYRHIDEEDDTAMESSFAQQMREEQISKKLGLKEDLEDMRQEAEEKKHKASSKRRKLHLTSRRQLHF